MTPHISPNLSDVGAQKRAVNLDISERQWELAADFARRHKCRVRVGREGVMVIGKDKYCGRYQQTAWTFDEIADMLQQMDGEESIADARALYAE